jgi:hypothetical protein
MSIHHRSSPFFLAPPQIVEHVVRGNAVPSKGRKAASHVLKNSASVPELIEIFFVFRKRDWWVSAGCRAFPFRLHLRGRIDNSSSTTSTSPLPLHLITTLILQHHCRTRSTGWVLHLLHYPYSLYFLYPKYPFERANGIGFLTPPVCSYFTFPFLLVSIIFTYDFK